MWNSHIYVKVHDLGDGPCVGSRESQGGIHKTRPAGAPVGRYCHRTLDLKAETKGRIQIGNRSQHEGDSQVHGAGVGSEMKKCGTKREQRKKGVRAHHTVCHHTGRPAERAFCAVSALA